MHSMSAVAIEFLLSFVGALAAGFLVGAEREHHRHGLFAGARTFPLFALAGALGMFLGPTLLAVLAGAVGILLAVAHFRSTDTADADLGLSTEMAALATFGIGALCAAHELFELRDRLLLAAGLSTAVTSLLAFKRPLHGFIAKLSDQDLYAAAKLCILLALVLPFAPDEDLGPWKAVNPREILWLVVLIASISFVGYVAMRVLGPRAGLGLTGLLGGLFASTAVTLTFSGRAREQPALLDGCAVAVVLASATMFPRIAIEVYVVSPDLAPTLLWPLMVAWGTGMGAGAFLYRRAASRSPAQDEERPAEHPALEAQSPFSILSAVKFASVFVAVLLASRAAAHYFDEPGAYLASVLGGLADVDPITLSLARLHAIGDLHAQTAASGIALAATINTLVKIALATVLGGKALGLRVGGSLILALVTGAASLLL